MKKFFIGMLALITCVAFVVRADYKEIEYTPNTSGVISITGQVNRAMTPISIMQEISNTETNTATVAYVPSGSSSTYKLSSLTAVIGGSEVAQVLNAGTNTTAPTKILNGDIWTITCAGTDYSNVVYTILYDIQADY